MSFFHTTPLGRIINRMTKDTVDADKNLADFAAFFLRSMLQLISTIVLIGIVTPLALPALLPIMLLFYFLYAYFQVSSQRRFLHANVPVSALGKRSNADPGMAIRLCQPPTANIKMQIVSSIVKSLPDAALLLK